MAQSIQIGIYLFYRTIIQVSKIMNPQTLNYLQQDEIGKVIAKGLATLYTNKPQMPVKYLADWLKCYSKNRHQMTHVLNAKQAKAASLRTLEESNKLEEINKTEKQKKSQENTTTIENFKKSVSNHEYQEEMLCEAFPEFVEKHTNITGAYVGYLNHPPREITEEDTDELAHLNTAAEKCINYIGSSCSHQALMKGKMLSLNQGVTAKAFSLAEDQAPVVGEDGQEVPQSAKEQFIYVPNVVKNEAMHYFKIPKLGAYLAVPLIYNSYLSEKIFDIALQAKNKYLEDLKEFNEKKEEQLAEMTPQKEELEKKINDLKEKNADDPNLEGLNAELEEIKAKIAEKEAESIQEQAPQLPLEKENYVFCVDNLGKDQQLNQNDISLIKELVEHFKTSIETKEKKLLEADVETQVNLIKGLGSLPEAIKESVEKGAELNEEQTKEVGEIEDEQLKAYKQEEFLFNNLKSCVKENPVFLKSFLKLKDFRVVKYKEVIQSILFFLGCSKADVNMAGKATLNWKEVKNKYITENTFNDVLSYIVQGAKTANFNFYSKTPFLTQAFDKFNEDEIFSYNCGLGFLLKFIKHALKLRNSNVELRKAQKEAERKNRQNIIAENEKIEVEKAAELEKHKSGLAPENVEGFDPEEWGAKYDEEHPLAEVPAAVVDDVDNDM